MKNYTERLRGGFVGMLFGVAPFVGTPFGVPPLEAQRAAIPANWDAFTRTFDSEVRRDSIVGASVLILERGQTIAHHDYGLADRALAQPVTERTIYHWASITKTLTAIAIMQLRDRGRLSLDDPIVRYVPELRLVHDAYGSIDSVTIRMLLSHSAGFQNGTWPYSEGKPWQPFEPTTWAQLMAMMPYQEVLFKPGSKYSYSNPGYIYLARVIEQLTGDPWEDYIRKNIFLPLGLTRSYFRTTPYFLAADRSNNYTVTRDSSRREVVTANGREFDPGITTPNGGWNAPLADLVTYLSFLTDVTRGDSATRRIYDTVLKRASLEEMWRPRLPTSQPGSTPPSSIGLSFFIVQDEDTNFIGHTGGQAGFLSFIYFNPVTSKAVVAAFNTNNEARPGESRSAFTIILREALKVIR